MNENLKLYQCDIMEDSETETILVLKLRGRNNNMELKIKVFQSDDGIFAEVLSKDNNRVCLGDGDSPYSAVIDACSVLSDIMHDLEQREDEQILKIVDERKKKSTVDKCNFEDIIDMLKD